MMSVTDSIRDILLTPLGSKEGLPLYGSKLVELMNRKVDDEFLADLSCYVIEAVERWEKRVKIDEVKLISFENRKLKFKIIFFNHNDLEISL